MTADVNGKGMQGAVMALYGVMVRPTATLRRISDNPATYLASSAAILVAVVVLGALFPMNSLGFRMGEISWDDTLYALVTGPVDVLLPILGIFWIGRRWGGNRSLGKAFPALAYCLMPFVPGFAAGHAALALYTLAVPPPIVFPDGLTLATGFAYGDHIIQSAIGLFIVGWTLLLLVKAIRILNGFGYARSAVVLALAVLIIYAVGMTEGLVLTAVNEFVL